jgi:hypothetical protein
MYSNPAHGKGTYFLPNTLQAAFPLTFYSNFIPPALSGQMIGSVNTLPNYFILIGWSFKIYLIMDLFPPLFTKTGNDNVYQGLENCLWE